MTPGAYLKKRREAAGLSIAHVAQAVAALPWAIRVPSSGEIAQLVAALERAETDRDNITVPQAELLRNAFRFDIEIYERLLWAHYGDVEAGPLPQLCRVCACSWCDPCIDQGLPCNWVTSDLCSACISKDEAASQLSTPLPAAMSELAGRAAA